MLFFIGCEYVNMFQYINMFHYVNMFQYAEKAPIVIHMTGCKIYNIHKLLPIIYVSTYSIIYNRWIHQINLEVRKLLFLYNKILVIKRGKLYI